jgi:hypothetical protein
VAIFQAPPTRRRIGHRSSFSQAIHSGSVSHAHMYL